MLQIKYFIYVVIMLFSIIGSSQKTVDDDPEILQNNINYRIDQAQLAIENYNLYEAQNHIDEALEYAEKLKDKKSLGIIYNYKGKIQLINKELDNAIKSLNKAIEIQRMTKDDQNLAYSYKTLGEIFVQKKDFSQASNYFKSAKKLFQQEELIKGLSETLLIEAETAAMLKKFKEARQICEQALVESKKIEATKIQSKALIELASIYNELDNYEKAISYSNEGIEIAKEKKYLEILNDAYFNLSKIHKKNNHHETSLKYLEKHIKTSDSLREIKISHSSKEQQTLSLLKKMDDTIKENEKKLEAAEGNKNLNTMTSILSVALITILSLLTLSLYKNNNIRLKTNNMLHKKNGELIIAKEKAELASKTKANFLSTVTHELRTPLYAVTGLSNMLLDENPRPEQVQHLKSLKFSGDYLLTFINDILQINKIEANKVEIEPESFNLKKKINNIILALNNSAQNNNVNIHFEYDSDLPENFIADQLKISQILINLIGNSIKFTKNGDIWIRVYKIAENVGEYILRFEVEDNGIGISQEKQDNMFESFSQGSIQINRKYGGTGLGLSIVKGLINILNGKINVKSELNKGTVFYFEIPLEYTSIEEATENKPTYFEGNKDHLNLENVTILVVEDNKINQMITKKILTKMELKCDIIDNGEDAIKMIKANDYNIVLMDIHMPGISGIETTKIIRSFDENLTVFALTAVTIEDKMHEFEEAGFTDIIPKPFKQEEFEKKLYNALTNDDAQQTA